jgi:SAM-dependent methyltransferase
MAPIVLQEISIFTHEEFDASDDPQIRHNMTTRHLDLGCGGIPRNPYQATQIFGVDIAPRSDLDNAEIRGADLFREPIPFQSNFFDSVSAYDFLEHIPRVVVTDTRTRFPFIEVMNEIWRVLKPNGTFYASTPAYPHSAAFQDPTHVNILTRQTHDYFTRPWLTGRMYGFHGDFECVRVVPVRGGEFDYQPTAEPGRLEAMRLWYRDRRKQNSHLVWEFKALKESPPRE